MLIAIALTIAALAYANGANDNFKGVASLYGSGVCGYRTAIGWATIATAAGSVAAVFLATALLRNFSGKGFVPDELTLSPTFILAVAGGAGGTVLLATRFGFPISTTHSLTGALLGSALAVGPDIVNFGLLGKAFLLPLLLSPLLAFACAAVLYLGLRRGRAISGLSEQSCLCLGGENATSSPEGAVSVARAEASVSVTVGETTDCKRYGQGSVLGIEIPKLLDALHFLSAGAVSFSRGLNDTPKIAGLLLVTGYTLPRQSLLLVAVAIAVGGLIGARRIAHTMSYKLTGMNAGQGFSANLATAALVTTASLHGLPVSTTHVSVGSLLGMGSVTGQAKWRSILPVLASWVITLPLAVTLAYTIALSSQLGH